MPRKNAKTAAKTQNNKVEEVAPVVETPIAEQPMDAEALLKEIEALKKQLAANPKSGSGGSRGPRVTKVKVPGSDLQVSQKFVRQMEMLIALGEGGEHVFESGDGFVVGPMDIIAAGWSQCYSTITNGWTRTKTAGMAARVLGYRTRATKREGRVYVSFHKVKEAPAE